MRILSFIIILLVASSCSVGEKRKSEDGKIENALQFPEPIGFVNDFEKVFTSDQVNLLEKRIADYEHTTSREIVIVTTDSIYPYTDIQKYGTDIASEWGVGKADKNNGLVIVFSKKLRSIRISTGLGTQEILTDQICKTVIDSVMIPEFKNGKYYTGIDNALSELTAQWNE